MKKKKYEILTEEIFEYIQTLTVGDMLPPESQMLKIFNASRNTYRTAIDLLKKDGILESKAGLGTTILSLTKQEKDIKLIQAILPNKGNAFWYSILEGINETLQQTEYKLLFSNAYDDAKSNQEQIESLQSSGIKGLLLIADYRSVNDYDFSKLNNFPPTVMVDNCPDNYEGHFVSTNDEEGAYEITKKLISEGHKQILHIGGYDCFTLRSRRMGYLKAMNEAFLDINISSQVGIGFEDGYAFGKEYLAQNKTLPDAVFGVTDFVALGFLKACEEANIRTPEDISIVGYANIRAEMYKRGRFITTMDQKPELTGREAAELLIKELESPTPLASTRQLLPVQFIDNKSTKAK